MNFVLKMLKIYKKKQLSTLLNKECYVCIKVPNKDNTVFLDTLWNCVPQVDLGNIFHSPCTLMKTLSEINSRHATGQIPELMQCCLSLHVANLSFNSCSTSPLYNQYWWILLYFYVISNCHILFLLFSWNFEYPPDISAVINNYN